MNYRPMGFKELTLMPMKFYGGDQGTEKKSQGKKIPGKKVTRKKVSRK